MKGQVLPSNMKPLRPLRSVSSHFSAVIFVIIIQKTDKKIPGKNLSVHKSSKTLVHIMKYDEVGMTS